MNSKNRTCHHQADLVLGCQRPVTVMLTSTVPVGGNSRAGNGVSAAGNAVALTLTSADTCGEWGHVGYQLHLTNRAQS